MNQFDLWLSLLVGLCWGHMMWRTIKLARLLERTLDATDRRFRLLETPPMDRLRDEVDTLRNKVVGMRKDVMHAFGSDVPGPVADVLNLGPDNSGTAEAEVR
jgi:hypothetical protein